MAFFGAERGVVGGFRFRVHKLAISHAGTSRLGTNHGRGRRKRGQLCCGPNSTAASDGKLGSNWSWRAGQKARWMGVPSRVNPHLGSRLCGSTNTAKEKNALIFVQTMLTHSAHAYTVHPYVQRVHGLFVGLLAFLLQSIGAPYFPSIVLIDLHGGPGASIPRKKKRKKKKKKNDGKKSSIRRPAPFKSWGRVIAIPVLLLVACSGCGRN